MGFSGDCVCIQSSSLTVLQCQCVRVVSFHSYILGEGRGSYILGEGRGSYILGEGRGSYILGEGRGINYLDA